MKRAFKILLFLVVVAAGFLFIRDSLSKSTRPIVAARPPVVSDAPAKVYGLVEPAGREVYVTSSSVRPVRSVLVREGESVKRGQVLVVLERDLEEARIAVAEARLELARKRLEVSLYELERKRKLIEGSAISQFEYDQIRFESEVDDLDVRAAEADLALAREEAALLELRSPVDGIVYKLDVRLGESLGTGETKKIILGSPGLWVRLYVESYWMGRIDVGALCDVYETETLEKIGEGTVLGKAPYLTARSFRVEDPDERFDAEFEQVVLEFRPSRPALPLGLNVYATLRK
jgi:multidrug efflux pump subunit AcrA (membrane-fusion protein)